MTAFQSVMSCSLLILIFLSTDVLLYHKPAASQSVLDAKDHPLQSTSQQEILNFFRQLLSAQTCLSSHSKDAYGRLFESFDKDILLEIEKYKHKRLFKGY